MRPNWLIVSELLGGEALRLVEIFGCGHSGMTTLHANSVEDALARLEAQCLMANQGLGLGEIRMMIAAAFQAMLNIRRLPDGHRRIMEITELRGVENSRYDLQTLFRYDLLTGQMEATGFQPSWLGA